jgi:hypothetical protein
MLELLDCREIFVEDGVCGEQRQKAVTSSAGYSGPKDAFSANEHKWFAAGFTLHSRLGCFVISGFNICNIHRRNE